MPDKQENIKIDFLLKGLKRDDFSAFDELFKLYSKKLYVFALKYLKSEVDAEDVVQEVFLTIWKERKKIKEQGTFKSYLFTIAYHTIVKSIKKRIKSNSEINENIKYLTDRTTQNQVDYDFTKQQIDKLIDELPPRCKQIFIKSRFEGLSHKKISEQLNISTKTIENQITKAISHLKKNLPEEYLEGILFLTLFLI